jgi:epoxyqueuosine reductase
VDHVARLRAIGEAHGLDRIGVTTAEPFEGTRVDLEQRKAAGLHGGMQFTYRNPARSTEPARALAGARTLVVGARAYPAEVPEPPLGLAGAGPLGRVARYATADHYSALRAGLGAIADDLRADGFSARVLADDNALVDRAAAARAGLGWFGKNANLLLEGSGSWFVLGSVLTDADLTSDAAPVADACGACTRCIDGCPTGAIVAPGVVDARRCLAWLVQAEGVFPEEHRVALDDRMYGCDTCQEVCPPSRRSVRALAPPSSPSMSQGQVDDPSAGRAPSDDSESSRGPGAWVPLLDILGADDDTLLERFGRWYIPRREPRYLRRNALVALANVAAVPATPEVTAAVRSALGATDPLVVAHGVWAAKRLGLGTVVAGALDALAGHPDTDVQAELARPVTPRVAA